MGELPFPDYPPPADFAGAWRLPNHNAPERHPLRRAALFIAMSVLELSLIALLFNYQSSVVHPQQPAMIMVQLQSYRPTIRLKEIALRFARAHAPKVAVPQFTIMPNTKPAPKSTMPVTMALASPLIGGTPQGGGSGAGDASGGVGSKASACEEAGYMALISRYIQLYFYYPVDWFGTRYQGIVYVHFVINRMGEYQLLEVAKSSGHSTLDQGALQIMRRASPLPVIPESLHADKVNGILPFVFELKGQNLIPTWAASGDC